MLGCADLIERLQNALPKISRHVDAMTLVSYWFKKDSRLITQFLPELLWARANKIHIYLATNQEHLERIF